MYDGKRPIRYNKALTKQAIFLFGRIVKKAYLVAWPRIDEEKEIATLDFMCSNLNCKDSLRKTIDFDNEEIWIEFTNGKIVEFSSNTYGAMRKADFANSKEI